MNGQKGMSSLNFLRFFNKENFRNKEQQIPLETLYRFDFTLFTSSAAFPRSHPLHPSRGIMRFINQIARNFFPTSVINLLIECEAEGRKRNISTMVKVDLRALTGEDFPAGCQQTVFVSSQTNRKTRKYFHYSYSRSRK